MNRGIRCRALRPAKRDDGLRHRSEAGVRPALQRSIGDPRRDVARPASAAVGSRGRRESSCFTVELACVLGVDQALERIRLRIGSHSEVTEEIAKTIYQGETTWANASRIDTTQALEDSVAAAAAVCWSVI